MTDEDRRHDDAASMAAIHNRIFFRAFQVGNTLQKQSANQLGISGVQWAVLGSLARPRAEGGMTVSELAEYLVVSRQNLDGVLTRLERDDYVERVPDATDKRTRRVRMTEAGWAFWNRLQNVIFEFYRQALVGFSFDERIAFAHFLNKVHVNLRSIEIDGGKERSE